MSIVIGHQERARPARRTRRLSVAQIVAAARALPPHELTMQKVADALGVDRKALNHHVVDKNGLLRLLATERFARDFADLDLRSAPDWRLAAAMYARAVRSCAVRAGHLAGWFRFDLHPDVRLLRPVEAMLEWFVEAGASRRLAGRLLTTLSNLATSSARDALVIDGTSAVARLDTVADVLPPGEGEFPVLRWMVDHGVSADDEEQFDSDLRVFLIGAAHEIEHRRMEST